MFWGENFWELNTHKKRCDVMQQAVVQVDPKCKENRWLCCLIVLVFFIIQFVGFFPTISRTQIQTAKVEL
jgi:hypothetical protein